MISTYVLEINEVNWNKTENELIQFVANERYDKIKSFRFDIDKKLSLYSSLLVRMGAIKLLNCLNSDLHFDKSITGKPFLKNYTDFHFSLSHTRNAIICAFSDMCIGVDVEKINDIFFDVVNICFDKEEIRMLEGSDKKLFYQIWTRKEAYAKWNGLGLLQDIKAIHTYENQDNFLSWEVDGYCFSIYSKNIAKNNTFRYVDLLQVYDFFITGSK